jgi:hypothetical protein
VCTSSWCLKLCITDAQVYFVLILYETQRFLVYFPLHEATQSAVAYSQFFLHLAEVSVLKLPQGLGFSLPGKPGTGPYQLPALSKSVFTIMALPSAPVELKINPYAIAPVWSTSHGLHKPCRYSFTEPQ